MSFSLSPAVSIREWDTTLGVAQIDTTATGVVGKYNWGPCFERKQVTTERELVSYFGLPDDNNFEHWFSAREFLQYSNNLWVVRAVDHDVAKNAGIAVADEGQAAAVLTLAANPYIPNYSSIPTITFSAHEKLHFIAKYPGALGNTKIQIAMATADDFATANINSSYTFLSQFEYAPLSNTYDKYDQVAIAVLVKNDLDDNWTIVEKWLVDLNPLAKDTYGKSNYIENVINVKSQWIYAFDNTTIAVSPMSFEAAYLLGGVDGAPAVADILLGYDLFENPEEFDVSLLMDGGNNDIVTQGDIIDICDSRMDCVAVIDMPSATVMGVDVSTSIAACVTYKTTTLNKVSSYAMLVAQWKYMYDKYNDVNRWIPISGDIAGIIARSERLTEAWYPAPGLNRGQFKNVIKFALNPKRTYRDTLYKNNINPVVSFAGEGNVLWGQKTLLSAPSKFGRLHIRRLFILLEKSIASAAKYHLFELNDEYQRGLFKLQFDPFLRRVKGRRGITDYMIVCDITNNPGAVVDANEFYGDFYIKAPGSIEFMMLNFVAVGTDVNFTEVTIPSTTI
jgi:hypothetical protein